jgi:hypothetical protein
MEAGSGEASGDASPSGREGGGELETVRARRTAAKALLAQAGTLKRLGRLEEALAAARRAADIDGSVHSAHVVPLEMELAARRQGDSA